jgi:hypothetical protein
VEQLETVKGLYEPETVILSSELLSTGATASTVPAKRSAKIRNFFIAFAIIFPKYSI